MTIPLLSFARSIARIAIILWVCVWVMSHIGSAADSPPADFTIATYNINYGNADLGAVADAIRKCGTDVVALQETNRESETFLRRELRKAYPHMEFRRTRDAAGGFAVLSKAPIEKPGYLLPLHEEGGSFGTQTVRVMIGGRELQIVNVHLTATVPVDGTDIKGMTELFLKTETIREKEIRRIVHRVPKRMPVLVLGDFNSIPKLSSIPGYMKESGFTDCMAHVIDDADSTPTWHWVTGGTEHSLRLDYIFSARISASPVSGRVDRCRGSDHYPVVCAFKWTAIPVSLGEVDAQALTVAYLVDAFGMTAEQAASARQLVKTSMLKLRPEQYLCVAVPGRKDELVPPEPVPAADEGRVAVLDALPSEAPAKDLLLPTVGSAMEALRGEAAPKALFIVSDRLGADARLLKSVRVLHADKRLQLFLVNGDGKPLADDEKAM